LFISNLLSKVGTVILMAKGKCEDIEVYEEMRALFKDDERLIFDTIALGVFSGAYRALKKEIYDQSRTVSPLDVEEFAHKVLDVQAVMGDYEQLVMSLNSTLQPSIALAVSLENGNVLDNAFANFLKLHPAFTYKELMNYFEERYSEKKLIKYVGSIPIYKKLLLFDRREIDARIFDLIKSGVIYYAGNGKGKKRELPTRFDKDNFISMPVVYGIFAGSWNPLAVYPEIESVSAESSRVLRELMSAELETNQAAKLLKLLFKDSTTDNVIGNFAGILSMYYEQMNEQRPEFLVETENGPSLSIMHTGEEVYETVTV